MQTDNNTPQTVGELRERYGEHLAPGYGNHEPLAKVLGNAGMTTVEEYLAQTRPG